MADDLRLTDVSARHDSLTLFRFIKIAQELADEIVRVVAALRGLDLRKAPSVAETIDWARALLALGFDDINEAIVDQTMGVLLKHETDRVKARDQLRIAST